ncbi:MAG: glycosyltransferase family 2 protein [Bryobacterales bacterium]|nr:glycosyltransferase family 2 protein [Bryobacterales bacterium]
MGIAAIAMTLSIVIICWNDWHFLKACLSSLLTDTYGVDYEIIVSDNGSTDGSVERVRECFPSVRVIENGANVGFAKGNNAGIREAVGEYILILNPDTVVHPGSLSRWLMFADRHPEAGAFGCRVLNPDGSYQESARPFPTIGRALLSALYLRPLARFGKLFQSDRYYGWAGDTERTVDWQSGCCVMFRSHILKSLGGFDERFFYHYEEVDLCRRVWKAHYTVRYTPTVTITHWGGQSVGRFPLRFALETSRNRYRYFYKHFGRSGATRCRWVILTHLRIRQLGYGVLHLIRPTDALKRRLSTYRVAIVFNQRLDPIAFVENGTEPELENEDTSRVL